MKTAVGGSLAGAVGVGGAAAEGPEAAKFTDLAGADGIAKGSNKGPGMDLRVGRKGPRMDYAGKLLEQKCDKDLS